MAADALVSCVTWSPASMVLINTLRQRQDGCRFADDTFKCIFLNENVRIPIRISLKFVPKGPINNIPALVQIMAWRRSCDKPLSEPMIVSFLMHICVTRPQWVMEGKEVMVFHKEGFQLPLPSWCWEMIKDATIFYFKFSMLGVKWCLSAFPSYLGTSESEPFSGVFPERTCKDLRQLVVWFWRLN